MNIKAFLVSTIFSLFFIHTNAQDKKQRVGKYDVSVGAAAHSILDQGYAAFTFNSLNPNYEFSFQRDQDSNRIGLGLNGVVGKTNYNDYRLFETNLIDVNLFAFYAKALDRGNEKTKIHIGGILDYRILFLLNMRDEFTVGNVSYTAALNLGLYLGLDYHFSEKTNLAISFKYPLLGNVVRNPYTGFDQSTTLLTDYGDNLPPLIFHNPEWVHGFKFFRPCLEVAMEKRITSRLWLVPKLSIEYLRYNAINPIQYFITNFSIGINF